MVPNWYRTSIEYQRLRLNFVKRNLIMKPTISNLTFENLPKSVENIEKMLIKTMEKVDELNSKLINQQSDEFITRDEVASLFKVDLSTIHNWVKKGKLKKYGIGKRVYFKRSEINDSILHITNTN